MSLVYKNLSILVSLIFLLSFSAHAQILAKSNPVFKDTVSTFQGKMPKTEEVVRVSDSLKLRAFKPDPTKVVWMAAIIPGYGQILNKKYWKLPLVYGGFVGFGYAIAWNSSKYNSYKNAYLDINKYNTGDENYKKQIDKDKSKVSFYQILPKGYSPSTYGGYTAYESKLKSAQDGYRRYRDLSIILTIGYYALTIVDAYVDAQLYDFDISPNLSMHIQPAVERSTMGNSFAMQCSFSLK